MNDSLFNEIQDSAKYLNLDLNSQEMAQFAMEHDLGEKQLQALSSVLSYLQEKKKELADQILGGEEMGTASFTREELMEILK